jgi:hypothetical protein
MQELVAMIGPTESSLAQSTGRSVILTINTYQKVHFGRGQPQSWIIIETKII